MKIREIELEWEKDSQIDPTRLESEVIDGPRLHSKYWKMLTEEKKSLHAWEKEMKRLKVAKRSYLSGKMSRDEIQTRGWGRYEPGVRIDKTYIGEYIDADDEILRIDSNIKTQEMKVKLLEGIIRMVHDRKGIIYSAMDYIKFQNGIN